MSEHIKRSHNTSLLLYHLVCPAKYRQTVFNQIKFVEEILKETCLDIEKRYDIHFVEIGTDSDHVHFLLQSVPIYSPTKIVQTVKSITARVIFQQAPEVKRLLWGGEFWTKGFYINTVGKHANEQAISNYVKNQGLEYKQIHKNQPKLFEGF
ncbi:transposase [Candidatus Berkelbacteria bacterium RIFCSPHIGHO2_12_FULL_36_9]|uniref:Transposase n=1 Tax=Candidatus Berkelbacteria bacterium RIFCSPHIGHO2_12_FULL_36_9 TaxID=1797469 RepID=A0A1F5EKJ2_9BACT|nr:MAG: transposase [Candidatus Berkelbacteria bacterium RIFCSPHIGHO2_12_FULL_36_9]